jgi:hypothetical protein
VSIVTRTHQEREGGCITYYIVIDQHFSPRVRREREKKNGEEKNKKVGGPNDYSFIFFADNRDVTTTTFDTSNNIYQMVRRRKNTHIRHLFVFIYI